uniref:Uncharacterized protein n=1 Tax=Pleomorphic virus ThalV2 TaxID=3115753 RepID=A0AAT9JAR5_9VIRU
MTDILSASPLLILIGLVVLSWFTGSKLIKVVALAVFFGVPLIQGQTALPNSLDVSQFLDFVINTVSYWLTEALDSLINYIKAKLIGSI